MKEMHLLPFPRQNHRRLTSRGFEIKNSLMLPSPITLAYKSAILPHLFTIPPPLFFPQSHPGAKKKPHFR